MKFYRAREGFWDAEEVQINDTTTLMKEYFVPAGTVIYLEQTPHERYWEPIRLTDIMATEARQLEREFKERQLKNSEEA